MKKRILVVESDPKIASALSDVLSKDGYLVANADHPRTALKAVQNETWDLIVVDEMLPDVDGIELCRQIRESIAVPVVLLTESEVSPTLRTGAETDADDYLPKPVSPVELQRRVRAALQRSDTQRKAARLLCGQLEIDLTARVVTIAQTPTELTESEFEVLALLARNPHRVFSRDQLMDALRGTPWEADNRSMDILISRLRQKLRDNAKQPLYIRTVWGAGYSFVGKINKVSDAA